MRPTDLVERGKTQMAYRTLARHLALCVLVAAPMTVLNSVKPLVMDDSLYVQHAHALAVDPGDPYGFMLEGYDRSMPAVWLLSPVFFHYWWSLAIRLFGENPFLWKLWLLPFHVLFVVSLHALFRRFAPRLEWPLTILTAYSPLFLPCTNLMLDVPSLALGLAAVVMFLRSCDGEERLGPQVVLAGLLAGASAQVKYTGLLVPAVFLAAGMVRGRSALLRALIATAISGLIFVGWEAYIAQRYGASHFLIQVGLRQSRLIDKLNLTRGLLSNLGALVPVVLMLGLIALGRSRQRLRASATILAAGYVGALTVGPSIVIYTVLGIWYVVVLAQAVRRLIARGPAGSEHGASWWDRIDPEVLFLLAWLGVEVLGMLALSPFSASRRLMGTIVVSTLIVGRLASRIGVVEGRTLVRSTWLCAVFSAAGGLAFFVIEYRDARAIQEAPRLAARYLDAHDGDHEHTRWYIGRWGFRYYADRAGFQIVTPGVSRLRRGDWLVVPDETIIKPQFQLNPTTIERVTTLALEADLPVRTLPTYYSGANPIEAVHGPRLKVAIYRLCDDIVPRVSPSSRIATIDFNLARR